MLPKNFQFAILDRCGPMVDKLFSDPIDAELAFAGAQPGDLNAEELAAQMQTSGFQMPDRLEVQMGTDPDRMQDTRCYRLVHQLFERDIDLAAVRNKCLTEMDGYPQDMVDDEVDRRIAEAKTLAPISLTSTELYVRADGVLIPGANGSRASIVINDFVRAFCGEADPDDEDKTNYPAVVSDKKMFAGKMFHHRCYQLILRDVFGDDPVEDHGDYAADPFDGIPIEFEGDFAIKLPLGAKMTASGVVSLPDGFRFQLQGADYQKIRISLEGPCADHLMTLNPKGEFKSVKLAGAYELPDEVNAAVVVSEMMKLREMVLDLLDEDSE